MLRFQWYGARIFTGQKFNISKPFSAGQYWLCLELVAADGSLIIARQQDELYSIACEVATMQFVRRKLPAVTVPCVYAYEGPGSPFAADAGAVSAAIHRVRRGASSPRTFSNIAEHFTAVGEAALSKLNLHAGDTDGGTQFLPQLGALVFLDIFRNTPLFADDCPKAAFPLNHMDLGTQNILIDDAFNFLAIIDWELAQTGPWRVNHYPMPFPLLWSDQDINSILGNPDHIAHGNVSRQAAARKMYAQEFWEVEEGLREEGRALGQSFADVLDSAASRVYGCLTRLRGVPEHDQDLVREMVRLAFGFEGEEMERYLAALKVRLQHAGGPNRSRHGAVSGDQVLR
ncbi:hypothetical protein N657DRAFT_636113 [Parathielavia appendiculata]|uniref:Aminoglycoside phosphotransferase domain-containing protein n=1 Tax=Parathielavia appendiculata TaxID=2587402 RepID=A0AAN6Z1Z7_9PEZI|nr:hypothetical protein N657DRAFT_636113 [Parathielavia appendiculata]